MKAAAMKIEPTKTSASSQDESAKILLCGLSHRYRHRKLNTLSDIDLAIPHGQVLAVVGRSGCGKSTLLQLIAGLLRPSSGEVRIDGLPVSGPSPRRNLIFQQPSLYPWMNVAQNVGFGLKFVPSPTPPRRRIEEMLQLVGLEQHAEDDVRMLSGGQQQRVALARSLATAPEVLLLDEPFSALDAMTRAELQAQVRGIIDALGMTAVLVTHDLDEALLMGDRIVVMDSHPGRVREAVELPAGHRRDRAHVGFQRLRHQLEQTFVDAARPFPATASPYTYQTSRELN